MDDEWTDEEGKAWWSILRSSTLLLRNLDADLQQHDGITLDWFDVLVNVWQYPDELMPLSALADNVVLSRSGLTRLLDRMEAAGLVRRTLSTSDRRRFDVSLTAKGRAEIERVWPQHQRDVKERCLRHLTAAEQRTIFAGLSKVIVANEAKG